MFTEIWCFWPLEVFTTSEVRNDHSHVIMQEICNKFIEIHFCVGLMVSQPNHLFQRSTTMSLINKIFQNLLDKNAFRLCQALFLLAHYCFHYLHWQRPTDTFETGVIVEQARPKLDPTICILTNKGLTRTDCCGLQGRWGQHWQPMMNPRSTTVSNGYY